MYVRRLDNTILTLQASGSLWRDALVMHDMETDTRWSQILGSGIKGKHKDHRLELYPSRMTSFAEFAAEYPDGRALSKPAEIEGSPYERYFSDDARMGVFGTQNIDDRLPGKARVIGVKLGDDRLAIGVPDDGEPMLYNGSINDIAIVAYWEPGAETAVVFKRPTDKALSLTDDGQLGIADQRWDVLSGKAADGTALEPVPFTLVYWFAWRNFYKDTRLEKIGG